MPRRARGLVGDWQKAAWEAVWAQYQAGIPEERRSPAQRGDLWSNRRSLHEGLAKAESSALTQLRTEKIGLAHFLHMCRVPGILSSACECGWRKQDARHVLLFCPRLGSERQTLLEKAGTADLREMLTTPRGGKAAARWLISIGLLGQFSLAKEQLYGRQ